MLSVHNANPPGKTFTYIMNPGTSADSMMLLFSDCTDISVLFMEKQLFIISCHFLTQKTCASHNDLIIIG